jgi:hypothetical protein
MAQSVIWQEDDVHRHGSVQVSGKRCVRSAGCSSRADNADRGSRAGRPYGLPVRHERLLSEFSKIMESFSGRPHWAKQHHLSSDDLRKLYPRFDDFVRVTDGMDPRGTWKSEYTRRHLGGPKEQATRP